MKALDTEIKNKLINSMVVGPPLIMLWLAKQIYTDLLPLIPQKWLSQVPVTTAIKTIALLSILNLLIIAYCIYLIFKNKEYKVPEPTINYGIYWDYMYHPLCPSCKVPLHQEELTPIQIVKQVPPKLICPNGHFNKYLMVNGEKAHPDKIRYDFLKINKMLIKKES